MKKVFPFLLVAIGIALMIYGFTTFQDSQGGIEIGDLEISATDQSSRNSALVYMVLGVISLVGGYLGWKKS